MTSFVYVITHTATCRHYVGKTNWPEKRWRQHVSASRAKKPRQRIHKAMADHGADAFQFRVIEEWSSEAEALEAEAFWVEFLRADKRDFGFNLKSGGQVGVVYSDETRAKMSAIKIAQGYKPSNLTPEIRARAVAACRAWHATDEAKQSAKVRGQRMVGRVLSDEHKAKCGEALRAKWQEPEFRAKQIADRKSRRPSQVAIDAMHKANREAMADPEKRRLHAEHMKEWFAEHPEVSKAVGDKLRGRKQSPEAVAKRSASRVGYVTSDATKQKLSAATKGRPKSEETKQRMRESHARRKAERLLNAGKGEKDDAGSSG